MRGSSRLSAQVVANGDVDEMEEGEEGGVVDPEVVATASPEDGEESEDSEEESSDDSEIVDFLAEDLFTEENEES